MELTLIIFGVAVLLGVAFLFLSKSGKLKSRIVGRLLDAAAAQRISTSGSLQKMFSALAVKAFMDFVTYKLNHASLRDAPVALQVAMVNICSLRVAAICEMLQLPTLEVVSSVVRGIYGESYDSVKFGKLSMAEMVASFTAKNIKDFNSAGKENRGLVVLSTLDFMSAPMESATPGSAVETSAFAVKMELKQFLEAMQAAV
jgi:hypothetical protein